MSANTWNFPTWQMKDQPPGSSRGDRGMVWGVGPQYGTTQPFTDEITIVFSYLMRDGWTRDTSDYQGLACIERVSATYSALGLILHPTQGLRIEGWNQTAAAHRYQVILGDEDGSSWISADKWYQVAISMNDTRLQYVVNGSSTPKVSTITNSPGSLAFNEGGERFWLGYAWGTSQLDPLNKNTNWGSAVLGPSAWYSTAIDLTDSTVTDRIFDSSGDLKNPGENGSLWFGDTYGATVPEYYFLDGSPRRQNGSDTQTWVSRDGGQSGGHHVPGGLRKQYES